MASEKPLNFLYQAYGSVENTEQVLFSILSLLKVEQIRSNIVVYTDRLQFFKTFFEGVMGGDQLSLRELSPERIQEWQGPLRFVHRLKIRMIQDALEKLKPGDKLVYLDGDTVFVKSPALFADKLQNGELIMHEKESILCEARDPLTKKIFKFLKREQLTHLIGPTTAMHNAGVLGMGYEHLGLVNEVLGLSDELHRKYQKHVMEQLAFSAVFAKAPVYAATSEIFHYWRSKPQSFSLIHSLLMQSPYAERVLTNPRLGKLIETFEKQNEELLALTRSKVARAKERRWWRWWERRS